MARFTSHLSTYVGVLVSIALGCQLSFLVMGSGVQSADEFTEFITDPSSLLYVISRVVLCLCYWFMRGTNNRTYLICWLLGDILGSFVFSFGLVLFLHESKNIYALNIVSFLAVVPFYLFCKYRLFILTQIYLLTRRIKGFREWSLLKIQQLSVTRAIVRFDFWLKFLLGLEFVIGFTLTFIAVAFKLSPSDSIEAVLIKHDLPNLFHLKFLLADCWTVIFILLLIYSLFHDRNFPDAFPSISGSVKKSVINKIKSQK